MRTTSRAGYQASSSVNFCPWLRAINLPKWLLAVGIWLTFAVSTGRAGLTLELHFYRVDDGNTYSFFTPLYTNSTAPAAPLGTYIISSPHQPTNGSVRGFVLAADG